MASKRKGKPVADVVVDRAFKTERWLASYDPWPQPESRRETDAFLEAVLTHGEEPTGHEARKVEAEILDALGAIETAIKRELERSDVKLGALDAAIKRKLERLRRVKNATIKREEVAEIQRWLCQERAEIRLPRHRLRPLAAPVAKVRRLLEQRRLLEALSIVVQLLAAVDGADLLRGEKERRDSARGEHIGRRNRRRYSPVARRNVEVIAAAAELRRKWPGKYKSKSACARKLAWRTFAGKPLSERTLRGIIPPSP